jgi:LmbE family N-acetylglucosaminyl deacetylase
MIALAAAAHPDDIEFMMAGTLLRLKDAGCEIHFHALPHGLNDELRQPVTPHFYTDITGVLARKRSMLACHASQKDWLDATQGMDAYLDEMERMSREVGRMSGKYEFAEGWRCHSHLGFAPEDFDPIAELLHPSSFDLHP